MEFLVKFLIDFPPGMPQAEIDLLYEREAEAAAPLIRERLFRRVWREPGTRNHFALWWVPDADFLHRAYSGFPMWKAGFGRVAWVQPLAVNPNDPGWPVQIAPNGFAEELVWANLYRMVEQSTLPPRPGSGGEAPYVVAEITPAPEMSLHVHPDGPDPFEVHVMVDGQKLAEIGPPAGYYAANPDARHSKADGYVSMIGLWMGQPVMHEHWARRIAADNGTPMFDPHLHDHYQALAASTQGRTR
jgi:muconolactone delta-isomerase